MAQLHQKMLFPQKGKISDKIFGCGQIDPKTICQTHENERICLTNEKTVSKGYQNKTN